MAVTSVDGRRRFSLGPVELWIVGVCALAIVVLLGSFANSFIERMDKQEQASAKQNEQLQTLVTQQAVTNSQLITLSTQLADIPTITRQVAVLKAEQDEHERRLSRLEDGGGNKLKGWTR